MLCESPGIVTVSRVGDGREGEGSMEEERRGKWRGEEDQAGGWSHRHQMHSLFVPYGIWVYLLGHQPLFKSVGVFRRQGSDSV